MAEVILMPKPTGRVWSPLHKRYVPERTPHNLFVSYWAAWATAGWLASGGMWR